MALLAHLPHRDWCGCLSPQKPASALRDIVDETGELIATRTVADFKDELSDVTFGIGRLVGGLLNRRFVAMPFAGAHIDKIAARMDAHGCVRSRRHLVDGRCPTAPAD